jgi:hypothetical protein
MGSRRFNASAFVFGLVFIAIGTLFLLDDNDVVNFDAYYILPILVIGGGLGLILGAASSKS